MKVLRQLGLLLWKNALLKWRTGSVRLCRSEKCTCRLPVSQTPAITLAGFINLYSFLHRYFWYWRCYGQQFSFSSSLFSDYSSLPRRDRTVGERKPSDTKCMCSLPLSAESSNSIHKILLPFCSRLPCQCATISWAPALHADAYVWSGGWQNWRCPWYASLP